jgi:hypothetical protein
MMVALLWLQEQSTEKGPFLVEESMAFISLRDTHSFRGKTGLFFAQFLSRSHGVKVEEWEFCYVIFSVPLLDGVMKRGDLMRRKENKRWIYREMTEEESEHLFTLEQW